MPFCSNCGKEVPAGAAFCPQCGQAQSETSAGQNAPGTHSGMSENVAALLAYVFGWITGIVFFLIDKRPFVRFHAAQSIVVFGGLHVIRYAVAAMFGVGIWMMGGFRAFGIGNAILDVIDVVTFIFWILLMIKGYQREKYEVPIAAGIAKSLAGN